MSSDWEPSTSRQWSNNKYTITCLQGEVGWTIVKGYSFKQVSSTFKRQKNSQWTINRSGAGVDPSSTYLFPPRIALLDLQLERPKNHQIFTIQYHQVKHTWIQLALLNLIFYLLNLQSFPVIYLHILQVFPTNQAQAQSVPNQHHPKWSNIERIVMLIKAYWVHCVLIMMSRRRVYTENSVAILV